MISQWFYANEFWLTGCVHTYMHVCYTVPCTLRACLYDLRDMYRRDAGVLLRAMRFVAK